MKYILEYNNFIGYFEITEDEYNKSLYGDDGRPIGVNDTYFNEKYMYRLKYMLNNFVDVCDKEENLAREIFPKSYVKKVDIIQNLIPINWRDKKNLPKDIDLYIPSDFKIYSLVINNSIMDSSTGKKMLPCVFMNIIKNKDDWFFVKINGHIKEKNGVKGINAYFKCDQIDGLESFLHSIK